ncbi:MAG: prepilin-type N-terminal cleavage/methylation domain-containing protein [Planctomycetes bacterium]|nr:prepilin-type N-terminal cleavage/methylation domain-containing protein [Planctomycetota bacterium]
MVPLALFASTPDGSKAKCGRRLTLACPRRRAFTLLEILLVIVVLAVIMGISWPRLQGSVAAEQLPESTRRLKALIAMCRAEAMNDGRQYCVYFLQDGSIQMRVQRDPIEAPQEFVELKRSWANEEPLLENVWVEAVQPLPDGPAPVLVDDDVIEFTQLDTTPVSVTELEQPLELLFEPNGACGSMRWILRDTLGRGMLLTLDGRLGRVQVDKVESLKAEDVERPPKLDAAEMQSLGVKEK